MKKLLSIIIAILMIVTTIPMAFAADIRLSGSLAGGNGKYELDYDGVLTISGEGSMGSISISSYSSYVNEIIIEDGITNVESNAFAYYSNLTSIYIADSVEDIRSTAFYKCKASKIYIGRGVKTIGYNAFYRDRTSASDTGAVVVHYNGTQEMWNAVTVDSSNTLNVHYLEKVSKPATCIEPGYKDVLACSPCNYVFDGEVIPATGEHTRVNGICTVCGDGCVHSYANGVCKICSIECKHDWIMGNCRNNCGLKGGNLSNGFVWKLNLTTGVLTVTGVGAMPTVYNSDNRSYATQVKTIVVAEGITSVGDYAFSNFSSATDVLIPSSVNSMSINAIGNRAKAHYFGAQGDLTLTGYLPSGTPTIHYCEERAGFDATCTVDGAADGWYCATCAKYVAGGEAIPAAHKTVAVEAKTPTCTEIGWDAYEYCTACDYTTYVEKEALKHSFTKYEVTEEAKCGVAGKEVATCDNGCGATDEKAIEALKHSLVLIKTTPAKCGEPMVEFYNCEFCCNCEVARPKFGTELFHSFTKYEITEAPTCNKAGEKAAPCDNGCGEIDVQTVPALDDHVDADGDYKCDFGCGHEFEKPAPEDDVCEDCGRPVHDDTLVQKFVCWIIMLVNLIKSMF